MTNLDPNIINYIDASINASLEKSVNTLKVEHEQNMEKYRIEGKQLIKELTKEFHDENVQFAKELKKEFHDENVLFAKELKKEFHDEGTQFMKDLMKGFRDEVKLVAEMVSSKPGEERVREIVQDEIKPLKTDVNIIKLEVPQINKKLDEHNAEMKQLRKDYNSHAKRLTKLENVLV